MFHCVGGGKCPMPRLSTAHFCRLTQSEKMLGRIEHELIHNMRIWQSYNPPDQQTEIALERHYVNNRSARLDFALLSKIILAARNADVA
jgi:hypothetical protein